MPPRRAQPPTAVPPSGARRVRSRRHAPRSVEPPPEQFRGCPVIDALASVGPSVPTRRKGSGMTALNRRHHRAALNVFMVIVLAHWAEHLAQAYQIWVLGWPRPKAR